MSVKQPRGRGNDDSGLGEGELSKLQRQYRVAEGGRKAYSEETQATLRKQRALIEKLEKDNEYLAEELAVAEGSATALKKNVDRGRELEARIEGYQAEINAEKQRCAELDKLILAANKELRDARKGTVGGKSGAAPSESHVQTMENRVEKANRKLNTMLVANGKLRDAIEHLRQERHVFNSIHSKLEKQLSTQKREMAQVIERSNQAYEQRDEIQARIATLKERAEKETAQYDNEIKDLTRALEHDRKLKSFMGVKGQERQKGASATQRRPSTEDKSPEELLKQYEAVFRKIKDTTGIEELEKLVGKFIETEDQNFALFNYVNELNREVETVREQLETLQRQMDTLSAQNETADAKRTRTLQELEVKLADTEAEVVKFEEQYGAYEAEFDSLKAGVSSIFEKIGCNPAAVQDMLGTSEITEANVMQYMRVIEDRTNELLKLRGLLDAKASEDWDKREAELRDQDDHADLAATLGPKPKPKSLLGAGPQPQVRPNVVSAPIPRDEEESDDELGPDNKPLSQAELKAKALRSTQRSERNSASNNGNNGNPRSKVGSSISKRGSKKFK